MWQQDFAEHHPSRKTRLREKELVHGTLNAHDCSRPSQVTIGGLVLPARCIEKGFAGGDEASLLSVWTSMLVEKVLRTLV
jgi:hypothetical protein